MKQLFHIELSKSLNYIPFRIIIGLHFLFFVLGMFALPRIDVNIPFLSMVPLFQFPHVWNFFIFVAGIYNITLVILVIMMTCLEFSNKTYKQQVIFGLSRTDLFKQKIILIFLLSLYVTALIFVTGMISGLVFSYKLTISLAFERTLLLLNIFFQTFVWLSVGVLFALMFKNMILSVLIFGFYRIFLEPVIRSLVEQDYRWFFPTKFISGLTPKPEIFDVVMNKVQNADKMDPSELSGLDNIIPKGIPIWQNFILSLVFLLIILWLSNYIFKKRRLN